MQNIKVLIDNKQVDLPTDQFILNMTYSLKDKNGIAINTGSRSEYSFEFPATNNNNLIFSRFWDIAENTSNKQIFLDAYIEVNGMAFFQGKCQLTGVDIRPDLYYWQGKTYKVAFYGNNVDWTVQVGNKFLYQYDYGTHTYNDSNIYLGLANIYSIFTSYKYILIKWKDWAVAGQVDIFEFTPALFIRSIVDRIFADINYSVQSNFFNTEFFKRLVLPVPLQDKIYDPQYGLDYLNIDVSDIVLNTTTAFVGVYIFPTQNYIPPLAVPNPYNNINGIYTVPVTGYYLLSGIGTISNITITGQMQFGFSINGNPVGTLYGTGGLTADTTITGEEVHYLAAGDTVEMGVAILMGAGFIDYEIRMNITGEAIVQSGLTVDFRYFINKTWNALDFIKGLAHAFNLTFQTDVNNRTVTIEPADTYLYQVNNPSTTNLQSGFYGTTTIDKTQNVDLDKEGEIFSVSEIPNQLILSWQYDSNDPTLDAINAGAGLDLMQAQFNFPANRFQSGQDVIENPFFSATLCVSDSSIRDPASTLDVIIPQIWSANYLTQPTSTEANYDILPRILYSDQNFLNYNGSVQIYSPVLQPTAPNLLLTALPSAWMIDYNNSAGNSMSLSFGNETVNGFVIKGLLERFYLYEFIRQQSGKQVECYVFWDIVEIFNLDFRKLVKIHGDNFILQEVNSFNVALNRSTKTYLLNNYLGDGTEASQIISSLLLSRLNA
jgi:hypothetical protein